MGNAAWHFTRSLSVDCRHKNTECATPVFHDQSAAPLDFSSSFLLSCGLTRFAIADTTRLLSNTRLGLMGTRADRKQMISSDAPKISFIHPAFARVNGGSESFLTRYKRRGLPSARVIPMQPYYLILKSLFVNIARGQAEVKQSRHSWRKTGMQALWYAFVSRLLQAEGTSLLSPYLFVEADHSYCTLFLFWSERFSPWEALPACRGLPAGEWKSATWKVLSSISPIPQSQNEDGASRALLAPARPGTLASPDFNPQDTYSWATMKAINCANRNTHQTVRTGDNASQMKLGLINYTKLLSVLFRDIIFPRITHSLYKVRYNSNPTSV
ncbi:hypothetical protein AG1IA_01449 [Rhizoctonia solani AG-1 IA]|uniref:Uncharacterized protein n=1 Tax=Thanatephorus cucumeris (strain AG1-IA) TaxID=983506 RepID=L8X2G7_THACA|nr:hypothetical protein AG1IA_01449 [Rhizoctonia solani AG-1 IA]